MQLGPEKADSLRCTTAPFTDVAADRWSAGYIAYCVEKGIIDGMGDGTFQPEAKLTGYQWAKMLLCAVGYGANDEYVGNSWSLNTAKDALDKGIFDGDLEGADHTPLQRQQAVLYAFNALTNEKASVVVYSPSLGDYILRYGDFADRATYEGTLGWNVYKLASSTGIIVDNEGMGNSKTVVSTDNKYDLTGTEVEVAANTDIDMMYHAAKIWHVGSGKTAIYVIDKATVTALTCNNITSSAVAKLEKSTTVDRTIGTNYGYDRYEYNFVDNGDLGTAGVSFYYDLGTLGTRSETRETTVIYDNDGKDDVMANSDIINDIKDLHNRDTVVYIHTNSTVDKTDEAWHVYPISATTGTVKDYSKTRGTITMADDTVLELSVFADSSIWNVIKRNAVVALRLDTHGHVIDANAEAVRVIGYFTGTSRVTSAHDAWFHDWTYAAQFVDVTTGEEIEVPVTNTVANALERNASNPTTNGYYDITTAVYNKTALTSATELFESNNIYASAYALKTSQAATFTASSFMFDTVKNNSADELKVFYDNDSVKIFVVSDRGNDLTVTPYDGVDDMIEKLSDGFTAKAVYLENIIVSGSYDPSTDAFYADTIFAFEAATASSGYLFLPEDITSAALNDEDLGNGLYRFEGAYLNGSAVSTWITVDSNAGYGKGFYNFTVTNGVYSLTAAAPITDYIYDTVKVYKHPTNNMFVFDPVHEGIERQVSSEATIVELREEAGKLIVDSVESLDDFWYSDYSDYDNALLQVGYTWNASGVVDVIYVVNQKYGTVTAYGDITNEGWSIDASYENEPIILDNADVDTLDVGATVKADVDWSYLRTGAEDSEVVNYGSTTLTGTVVANKAGTEKWVELDLSPLAPHGVYNVNINIKDIYRNVTVYTLPDFVTYLDASTTVANKEVLKLDVGEEIKLGFLRADAKNLAATYTVDNGVNDVVGTDTFSAEGHSFWTKEFVPAADEVTVKSIVAKITLQLDEATGAVQYFSLAEDAAINAQPAFSVTAGDKFNVALKYNGEASVLASVGEKLSLISVGGVATSSQESAADAAAADKVFTYLDNTGLTSVTANEADGSNVVTIALRDGSWGVDTNA